MVCGLLATADSYWGASLLLIHFLHFEKSFVSNCYCSAYFPIPILYILFSVYLIDVCVYKQIMELIFDMLRRLKRHHKMLKTIVISPLHFICLFIYLFIFSNKWKNYYYFFFYAQMLVRLILSVYGWTLLMSLWGVSCVIGHTEDCSPTVSGECSLQLMATMMGKRCVLAYDALDSLTVNT